MRIFFPIIAALVAWLLTGSPVPMALTLLLFALVGIISLAVRVPLLVIGTLVFSATLFQIWLFRTGQALAMEGELSPVYHLAIALLWWDAAITLAKQKPPAFPWIAFLGAAFLVSSAIGTDTSRHSPWLICSLASLPLAGILVSIPKPVRRRYLVPAAASITLLAVTVGNATNRLTAWIETDRPSSLEPENDLTPEAESVAESGDGSSRRLPRDADISFNQRIEFYLRTNSASLFRRWLSQPLYVRVSTATLFENDEVIGSARSGRWLYDEDDGLPDNSVPLTLTQPSPVEDYTLLIERRAADALPLLEGTTRIATDMVYEYADDWYQLTPPKGMDRIQYTVSMPATRQAVSGGSGVFSFGAAEPGGVYLNLPETELPDRIRKLCRTFDDERILEEIKEHLFLTTDYSLKFSTPEGLSPVENFLFGDGRGHCEIYAASAVMMLRSVGIPSRLAYGYAGGAADRRKGIVAFRDSDSHAWAEILRPGGEWEIFDTTPQSELAANRIPESENVATLDPSAYYDFSNTAVAEIGVASRIGDIIDFLNRHFIRLTAVGLIFVGVVWWRVRPARREDVSDAPNRGKSDTPFAPAFLRELEMCWGKKAPGSTWREYISRLDLPSSFQSAIDYYYGVRYADATRNPEFEDSFARQVREWRTN